MDTYNPFPTSTPPLIARAGLANQITDALRNQNVSVIGRKYYGKTVLLKHLHEVARNGDQFTHVVYWDLRHFVPEDDARFFQGMCEQLCAQLGGATGNDARSLLGKVEDQSPKNIGEFMKLLEEENEELLLILDGVDAPLSSPGLSKNVWDYLCSFADLGSLKFLAGSRERLRELCINPESRTSDFFRRFDDPPTVLRAFSDDELTEFLSKLEETRVMDKGARSEFVRQTGRIPILCAVMARLLSRGDGGISQPEILSAAVELLASGSEAIPEAFGALNQDEQMGFAELCQRGSLKAEQGRLSMSLVHLGFAAGNGTKLTIASQLLKDHVDAQSASLCSIHDLFGSADAYETNIVAVAKLRGEQVSGLDTDFKDFLTHCLNSQNNPRVMMATIRSIVDHSLRLIWDCESPDGRLPRFTSEHGMRFIQNNPGDRIPSDSARQLQCLGLLTDDRNGVKPKKANKAIYCLVSSLKGFGDLGQHQESSPITAGLAASVCMMATELATELHRAGISK